MRKFVFLIFITFSSVLHAQDSLKKDIANAASIENSIKRLAAFDAVAKKYYLAPGSKTKQETGGKWNIIVDTSPLDDLQTVTAVLASDSPVNKDQYSSLILRYKEDQFDTYI
ncbi:MAG: hypothetical protein QGI29_04345, partial [Pirellulales bacterium]|nr:hypothetical protein [Pirellulales bacterium]